MVTKPAISSETHVTKPMTWDSIQTMNEPSFVKVEADKELKKITTGTAKFEPDSSVYRAFTLREFTTGFLLSESLKEEYKTLIIQLNRDIQKEYNCETPSQYATAELIACAYGRVLQASTRISKYLEKGDITDLGIKYFSIMSKELDRAQRQYQEAIQTLYMLKQPPLNVTVKANIANIANQQVVQEKIIKPI